MDGEQLELTVSAAEETSEEVTEVANAVDLSVIESALDSFAETFDGYNDALAGIAALNSFTFLALLLVLGALLFLIFAVAVRRL